MFRRFPVGDIIVQRNVSSSVLEVTIAPRRRGSISSGSQLSPAKVVKIKKTMQHVRLLGLRGDFTSVTVEQVEGGQQDFDAVSIYFSGSGKAFLLR